MERKILLKVGIFIFAAVGYVQAAADSSCNSQYQGYNRCMKTQLIKNKNPNTGLPRPANSVQTNLQISNIRACFKENNCRDPLAPEASNRARGLCFPPALKGLRDELQACVKKNLSNFQLPEDEYSVATGNNDVLYLLASTSMQNVGKFCPSNVNSQAIFSCVAKKWTTSGIAQTTSNASFCDTVQQCKSVSFISDNCYSSWNDLVCPCVQSMRFLGTVTKYENQYIDCMKQVGVTVDKSNETPLSWFDASVKGWCDSLSSNRGASWAPGNRFCDAAATTAKVTTAKVTTAKITTVKVTTPTPYQEETTERTWFFDQFTNPPDQEATTDNSNNNNNNWFDQTNSPDEGRTWFFDQWTLPPDEPQAPTTTEPPPTTKKSGNWPSWLENIGIQNPMDGAWGDIIHSWGDILKPNNGGKRK